MKTEKILCFSVLASMCAHAATIDDVIVRQQWPWSSEIKIEYVISGVVDPVNLTIEAFDGNAPLNIPVEAVKGDIYGISANGIGTITIYPEKAFAGRTSISEFNVRLTPIVASSNVNEVVYKIIDIEQTPMSVTDVTRADILNGKYGTYETDYSKVGPGFTTSLSDVLIWTGVTNGDLYRTSKIALRKIPAAGKSFTMGVREDQKDNVRQVSGVNVSFSHDYWIGVFEMTQYQIRKLNPSYESWETNVVYRDVRAGGKLSYTGCRGDTGWPKKTDHSDVTAASPIGVLQRQASLPNLDLPTEAQWEFAARAGTTTDLPSGKDYSIGNYAEIGRGWGINCEVAEMQPGNAGNVYPLRDSDLSYGIGKVGMYRPNAYGLYDMMGNAMEAVLDISDDSKLPSGGLDPVGAPDWVGDCWFVLKGGTYQYQFNSAGYRARQVFWQDPATTGFRLCLHEN